MHTYLENSLMAASTDFPSELVTSRPTRLPNTNQTATLDVSMQSMQEETIIQ